MENDPLGQRKVITPIDEERVRQELAVTDDEVTEAPAAIPDVVQITNPVAAAENPLVPDEPSRFPWLRTLLIGLSIPIVWVGLTIALVLLLGLLAVEVRGTPGVTLFVAGALLGAPWIAAAVVSFVGSSLLKRMGVLSGFVLSAGTLVFFSGAVLALQAARLFTTSLNLEGSIHLSEWVGLQAGWLALLVVSGVIGMTLLVLVTNTLRDRLPGFLIGLLVLLIIAAPWGAKWIAEAHAPSAQQLFGQSLLQGSQESLSTSGVQRLVPDVLFSRYDKEALQGCLDQTLVATQPTVFWECSVECAQTIDGQCLDIELRSTKNDARYEVYAYQDGNCDAAGLSNAISAVARFGTKSIGTATPEPCRALSTPSAHAGGRSFQYAQGAAHGDRRTALYGLVTGRITIILRDERTIHEVASAKRPSTVRFEEAVAWGAALVLTEDIFGNDVFACVTSTIFSDKAAGSASSLRGIKNVV